MGQTEESLPSTWAQEILADVAVSLLRSDELLDVRKQAGIDEETLLARVRDASAELILARAIQAELQIDAWEFLEGMANDVRALLFRSSGSVTRRVAVIVSVAVWLSAVLVCSVAGWVGALVTLLIVTAILAGTYILGRLGPPQPEAWISGDQDRMFLGAAPGRWVPDGFSLEVLSRQVLAPFLREQINAIVNARERRGTLYVSTAPGLDDLSEREQIVRTSAANRLTDLTNGMVAGSVGVSGARGVGKTTLLRGLCDTRLSLPEVPELRVMVSAPVDYDVREFILHLFARLCAEVAGDRASGEKPVRAGGNRSWRRILCWIFAGICAAAGVGVLAAKSITSGSDAWLVPIIYYAAGSVLIALGVAFSGRARAPISPAVEETRGRRWSRALIYVLTIGTVVFGGWVIVWTLGSSPRRLPDLDTFRVAGGAALLVLSLVFVVVALRAGGGNASFQDHARSMLHRVRFLQTFTTGYSGGLNLPAGAQIGGTVSRQLTEQQLTLPELVDLYRDFAARTARWWRGMHRGDGRLVIGIDEIDRIADAETAERFVNDVKAIFGTPHCLYLVSVSEEAMARFQLRASAGHTAFDSAFDEITRVEPLTFGDVRELLRRRVAGISDPFIALCHVLSGGLPRDVIRTARTLIVVASRSDRTLPGLAAAMVAEEISNLKYATVHRLTVEEGTRAGRGRVLSRLLEETWPENGPEGLMAAAREAATWTEEGQHALGVAVTLYFLATVAATFVYPGDDSGTQLPHPNGMDELARARASITIDARLADELISRYRQRQGWTVGLGRTTE